LISINIYDLVKSDKEENGRSKTIKAFEHQAEQYVNSYNETLKTFLIENNLTPNGYRNFRIVTDKVYDQTVRVKGEVVKQVVIQETYQAYCKQDVSPEDSGVGALITLCKKDDAVKVKGVLEKEFNLKFEQHSFDILKIIDEATDVRNAKFNVEIETVNSVSMGGTRVNDTAYYARMLQQGHLKAVIITFDMPGQTVTLRISVEGAILLYSQLSDNEILDLVEQLLDI